MVIIKNINRSRKGGLKLVHIGIRGIKYKNATINIYGKITKEKIEESTINYLKKVDKKRKRGSNKWEQR